MPNTQTLRVLRAVAPVSSLPVPGHRLAMAHFFPFQCSTYCPSWLMAQILPGDGALAPSIMLVSPPGRATARQCLPSQCSATGAPGLAPSVFVPPKAQASWRPGETTLR